MSWPYGPLRPQSEWQAESCLPQTTAKLLGLPLDLMPPSPGAASDAALSQCANAPPNQIEIAPWFEWFNEGLQLAVGYELLPFPPVPTPHLWIAIVPGHALLAYADRVIFDPAEGPAIWDTSIRKLDMRDASFGLLQFDRRGPARQLKSPRPTTLTEAVSWAAREDIARLRAAHPPTREALTECEVLAV